MNESAFDDVTGAETWIVEIWAKAGIAEIAFGGLAEFDDECRGRKGGCN